MRILETGARRTSSAFAGDEEGVEGVEGEGVGVGVPWNRRRKKDMMRERGKRGDMN